MFKIIAIIVVVLLAALFIIAGTKPDTIHVERSANIAAPPDRIYPLIDNFNHWRTWSPYEKLDPAMKRTVSGAPSGKGAVYEWQGNSKAGQGRMEITQAVPPHQIDIQLDFIKPMEAHNTAAFTLQPQGDSTRVTWSMDGPNSFFGKLMCVFFDMDKMIGKDFETGLANLKAIAEKK